MIKTIIILLLLLLAIFIINGEITYQDDIRPKIVSGIHEVKSLAKEATNEAD